MRRAVIATVGTVLGLAALLSYKSGGAVKLDKLSVGGQANNSTTTVPAPATRREATTGAGSTGAGSTGGAGSTTKPGRTSAGATSALSSDRSYTGDAVRYLYGDIQVDVVLKGSRVVSVSVPENQATDPHSAMINSEAVPVLIDEAVSAQGKSFDAVSGATFTSRAFAQSLESALEQSKR